MSPPATCCPFTSFPCQSYCHPGTSVCTDACWKAISRIMARPGACVPPSGIPTVERIATISRSPAANGDGASALGDPQLQRSASHPDMSRPLWVDQQGKTPS